MTRFADDPVVRDLQIMECAPRYHDWILSHFQPYVGHRVLECGAGIGTFTRFLLDRELVLALDNHRPCLDYLQQRLSYVRHVIPLEMDLGSPSLCTLATYHLDTIIAINVLEHVERDDDVLSRMADLLQSGGRLLLLVPALPSLYGSIDQRLGHYRRYTKPELTSKLRAEGFLIHKLFYMNAVAVPGWFLNNRVLRRTDQATWQVQIFDRLVVPWLCRIERLWPPPFGLSLVAITEKPSF